jgi:hypothetical protein
MNRTIIQIVPGPVNDGQYQRGYQAPELLSGLLEGLAFRPGSVAGVVAST